MPNEYRAIINIDLKNCPANERQRFMKALQALGWDYTGTSAMALDAGDLLAVGSALEVLARTLPSLGTLTALTVQAQRIVGGDVAGTLDPENALATLLERPLPSEFD